MGFFPYFAYVLGRASNERVGRHRNGNIWWCETAVSGMIKRLPSRVKFIQLRVSRATFHAWVSKARAKNGLPDLPFDRYIQALWCHGSTPRTNTSRKDWMPSILTWTASSRPIMLLWPSCISNCTPSLEKGGGRARLLRRTILQRLHSVFRLCCNLPALANAWFWPITIW